MAERRVPVTLKLNDNFSGRLTVMAEAAKWMARDLELRNATWEPHDWDEF